MPGLTTEELMAIALDLVGLSAVPADSGIHVPGTNIRRILFAMDVNVGLLCMAKQLGFDAVVGHHPCGVLYRQGEVYRRHIDLLELHGVSRDQSLAALAQPVDAAVRRLENRRFRMLPYESPNNTVLEVDAARLLHLPFMNIHNAFDEAGRRILQAEIDDAYARHPAWTLGDVLALVEALPEARAARGAYGILPILFLGDPQARAGRTVFVHGALSAPSGAILRFYWEHGFDTVVVLHEDFETLEALRREGRGQLVLTGHFLGDSLGMTPFIRTLRGMGLEVVCAGGIIDLGELGE
jgi:hypothetical protein